MDVDELLERARQLKFYGMIAHWDEIKHSIWVKELIVWEENERAKRSLDSRLKAAKFPRFKQMVDFDWSWPKKYDRALVEEILRLDFIKDTSNIIFSGANGVGKSTIACNIGYQSVMKGYSVLFTTAGNMLNDLASQDGDNALRRRLKYYTKPQLLIIDEVGYLSYGNRHADLLFEIVSRRYQEKPSIITTNRPFSEWRELFPNASCVVSLIDRLVHNSEIVSIEADSFRLKEAKEKSQERQEQRNKKNEVSTQASEDPDNP